VLAQEHVIYPAALRGFVTGETYAAPAASALRNPLPTPADPP
jgi:hypothetical protein